MKKPSHYPPFYLRAVISVLAAGYIVLFGSKHSLWEALHIPSFYFAMSCSFIIAMILVNYIHWVTVRLDMAYGWRRERVARRLGLQAILGLLIPVFMDFFLARVYFYFYRHDIYKTGYMIAAFPQIILMLLSLNLIYALLFLLKNDGNVHTSSSAHFMPETLSSSYVHDNKVVRESDISTISRSGNIVNEIVPSIQTNTQEPLFNLHNGLALPFSEIACLFRIGDSNYLYTFSGKKHLLIRPLKKLESQLTENGFFRVNRQMIINRKLVGRVEGGEIKGTLQIIPVDIPIDQAISKELFTVSVKRVRTFELWIALSGGH